MSKSDWLIVGALVIAAGGVFVYEKNKAAPAKVLAAPSPGRPTAPGGGVAAPSSGGGVLADVNTGVEIATKLYDLGDEIWGDN